MGNDAGFEIVADDTQRYAAEILKHMDIAVDPALLIHIQARFDIRKLAVRKRRKEVYRIHLMNRKERDGKKPTAKNAVRKSAIT